MCFNFLISLLSYFIFEKDVLFIYYTKEHVEEEDKRKVSLESFCFER